MSSDGAPSGAPPAGARAESFAIRDVLSGLPRGAPAFAEFFRAPTLSMTAGVWPRGSRDDQTPHTEDEVYLVASGRAQLEIYGEDRDVEAGMLVYVPAGVEHRFHSIERDLEVIVLWSPPRHSNAKLERSETTEEASA